MKQTKEEKAIANKIRKWIKTAKEAETQTKYFGLSITRLTSIKSLCEGNRDSAEKFAFFIAQKIQAEMNKVEHHDYFSPEQWEQDKSLFNKAMDDMKKYIESPNDEFKNNLREYLKEIESVQGDDIRRVHWSTTVHFVRSGYLLKLEYALNCFVDYDYPYYAYQLARKYVEANSDGIMAQSIPMLLEVAEFWCQYYLAQSSREKFPKLMSELTVMKKN
jgi:hypothetical protein